MHAGAVVATIGEAFVTDLSDTGSVQPASDVCIVTASLRRRK